MRGGDVRTGALFSYVDLEARVRRDHPLRAIREIVNAALATLERLRANFLNFAQTTQRTAAPRAGKAEAVAAFRQVKRGLPQQISRFLLPSRTHIWPYCLPLEEIMLERGSIWRRWDLHVHTPDTAANNKFGTWDEYLDAIEAQSDVRVIGVTDYLLLGNYSKMRAYKAANRLPNIDYLIPNIEFRLSPPTDKDTAVNIHLLVCPDDPRHEEHITNAMTRLSWEYRDHPYSCTPEQLTAFGRAVDPTIKDDAVALRKGAQQFKIDFSALRDWYKRETWLRQNSIVAVSGNKDGLAGFLTDGGWAAHREEITRFSHMVFSARPDEIDFWLGRNKAKDDVEQMKRLGGPKPCIHGSDAHSVTELFKPTADRFCWVKADTNFEGLKQLLLEPAERVYIGPTPPLYHDTARVIQAVRLKGCGSAWKKDPVSGVIGVEQGPLIPMV